MEEVGSNNSENNVQVQMESLLKLSLDSANEETIEESWEMISDKEVEDIKQSLQNETLDSAIQKIKEYFEQLDETELNIAVTGGSGKGKSTFVNAIRGLEDEDEGSAPTGVVETTMESMPYPYPNIPNVVFWDLPGIGTENFKAEQYLEKVEFHRYDFFIIISSERFTSNDANLAREIQKLKKNFYFIRSKIDHDVKAAARKKNYNEKATLDLIRQNCITGLEVLNVEAPKVFLINSHELGKYDFLQLQETLEKELSVQKRHILLLALPNITQNIIQKKKKELQANIWKVAFLSGAMSTVPIPGLDFEADVSILKKEISKYYRAFGVDEASLKTLSERVNVPMEDLKKVVKSGFDTTITDFKVINLLTTVAAFQLANISFSMSFGDISVLGSLAAGGIGFSISRHMLQSCLDELAESAHLVMIKAFSNEV